MANQRIVTMEELLENIPHASCEKPECVFITVVNREDYQSHAFWGHVNLKCNHCRLHRIFDGLRGMVKDLRESAKRPLVQPNEARILNRCADQLEKYLVREKEGA